MSCENCKKALELLEDCQKKMKDAAKILREEPKIAPSWEPSCMELYKDRVLLKVSEAAEMCGMSRSTAYQMLYNGEWSNMAIRVGERAIRIPMQSLLHWVEKKQNEGIF